MGLERWPPGPVHAPVPPLTFSAGRAALAAILRHERPRVLHVPDLICGSVIAAAAAAGVEVAFHAVDEQLLPELPTHMSEDGMVLLLDYAGIRRREVQERARVLGRRAIIDASMAFFHRPVEGCWWFTSARKFFGLPDGATVGGPEELPVPEAVNPLVRADHLLLAHLGRGTQALDAYRANNAALGPAPLAAAPLSQRLFERIDREAVRAARTRNFRRLHERLGRHGRLRIDPADIDGPLYYPLHLGRPVDLHRWHAAGIFAPCLWPDVLQRGDARPMSRQLVASIVPLPVDQRYTEDDMDELAWRAEGLF